MKARLITVFAVALATTALAVDPHSGSTKGQPNQSCEESMVTPGNAVNAQGSAFNPNGTAQGVYANPDSPGGTSSGNTHVVAQYDVGCFQQLMRLLSGHGH